MPTLMHLFFRDKVGTRRWPEPDQISIICPYTPQCSWSYFNKDERQYIMTFAFNEDVISADLDLFDIDKSVKLTDMRILSVSAFYRTSDVMRPEMEFFSTKFSTAKKSTYVYFPITEDGRLMNASFYLSPSNMMTLTLQEPCLPNTLLVFAIICL